MAISNILIIDCSGECSAALAQLLKSKGLQVLTACKVDVALKIMADNRPELILVDCSSCSDPLFWQKEADRLVLAAQVVALTDQADFEQAMDWVAGGLFSVLTKPVSPARLEKVLLSVAENSEAFHQLNHRLNTEITSDLADFYRGLCGRLEIRDLRKYIVESCRKISGARQVELRLSDLFSGNSYHLESHIPISVDSDEDGADGKASGPDQNLSPREYHLSYDLIANGMELGELNLNFSDETDLRLTRQEDLIEMVMAISNSLGAAAAHNKAVKLAAHDALTGLYNRRIFNEIMKREFAKAQRHNFPLTLLALDLDHFKRVNDTYGHQVGDEVLKVVANTINTVARTTDFPARLGGEEFAILLTHTSQEQAMVLAKRLQKNLAETSFEFKGEIFTQTISQGISGLEHFMVKSPEDMIYWADQSLYLAKREGRDTIRVVTDLPLTPIMKDGAYAFQ